MLRFQIKGFFWLRNLYFKLFITLVNIRSPTKSGFRKEGREEGRKEGRKKGGKEGRKQGGKEGRKEGRC